MPCSVSGGIKGRFQPDDLRFHKHHIETTGREGGKTHQIKARSKYNAFALDRTNAGCRTTMQRAGALADLYEHQGVVFITHDEVNFAPAPSRRPIIALKQLQSRRL